MNILEAEDMVKGLPDQVLYQYAQNPPPQIPQFLAISEVQRRQDMRQRFQARQGGNEPTVKDQILQGGIAGAGGPAPGGGEPPPMAPPGAAPPGAPMQQPMTGAPMPPMGMSDGGRVPGGNPQVFREFMRRNFATPQGLGANIGLVGGAMLGGPIGAGIGANLGTYIGQKLTPPTELTPWQMQNALGGGLRVSDAPAMGGGGGGGLPYGGPTSYGGSSGYGRNELMNLLSQFGDRKKPTVTVEEIPQGMAVGGIVPQRMNTGGLTPGGIVYMQAGRTVPDLINELRNAERSGDRNTAANIRSQLEAAGVPISDVINQLVNPAAATPPVAPAATPPAPTTANDFGGRVNEFMGQVPGIFAQVNKMMPAGGGLSAESLNQFRPTESDYINPQVQAQREALLAQLRSTGETRRAEDIAAAQRYLTEAEAPIKQAQDEARRSAIASTLMRLGSGVMAGRPEAGLASAAESVESIMSRAREQASAERRAARQDFRTAERAATQAARSTADAAFQMQAQNITADENKQQQFVRDQKQFAQWAFGQMREAGRDARQAQSDAVRLSLGLAQTIDTAIRTEARESALTDRQYAQTFGSIFKEVFDDIKTGYTDAEGNEVSYTPEQAIELAGKRTRELLTSSGISPTGSGDNVVVYQGKPIRFPNKEAADKFRNSVGM